MKTALRYSNHEEGVGKIGVYTLVLGRRNAKKHIF
jgi:hypothetical protein